MRAVMTSTLALRLTAFVCAAMSLLALVSHVAGALSMSFFLTFFGLPSILCLLTVTVVGKWLDESVFLNCLSLGLAAGIIATMAYDVSRIALQATGLFHYDSFKAITIFGQWISGTPASTWESAVAGWTYHYWNGISFAVMYLLTFGRRPWIWGVGYGIAMELCMLGIFPVFLTVKSPAGFVVVSLIGHTVYGAVLGFAGQRFGRSWSDVGV